MNHKIHLVTNTNPISVNSYRYPYFQKSDIEKLIAETIKVGMIKSSQSHLSYVVLLVKKKDGT